MHIRPTRESDAASFCDAVKAVAAEKWYLATVDGYSLEQTREFVKHVVEGSLPQMMAVDGDVVVGFCDIIPIPSKGFTHVGRLGMGVRLEWRRQNIGRRLLDACLSRARDAGIEKVELEVYTDNIAAMHLYQSFGFCQEGIKVRARKLEDRYQDLRMMALWL